jgi:hypothetical protein
VLSSLACRHTSGLVGELALVVVYELDIDRLR